MLWPVTDLVSWRADVSRLCAGRGAWSPCSGTGHGRSWVGGPRLGSCDADEFLQVSEWHLRSGCSDPGREGEECGIHPKVPCAHSLSVVLGAYVMLRFGGLGEVNLLEAC